MLPLKHSAASAARQLSRRLSKQLSTIVSQAPSRASPLSASAPSVNLVCKPHNILIYSNNNFVRRVNTRTLFRNGILRASYAQHRPPLYHTVKRNYSIRDSMSNLIASTDLPPAVMAILAAHVVTFALWQTAGQTPLGRTALTRNVRLWVLRKYEKFLHCSF